MPEYYSTANNVAIKVTMVNTCGTYTIWGTKSSVTNLQSSRNAVKFMKCSSSKTKKPTLNTQSDPTNAKLFICQFQRTTLGILLYFIFSYALRSSHVHSTILWTHLKFFIWIWEWWHGAVKTLFFLIIWQAPRAGSMRRILCSDWLPERARWSDTARPALPVSFPQIKFRQSSSECTNVFSPWNYFLLR